MMTVEGWKTCKFCGRKYYLKEIKMPFKDDVHQVACPYCGKETWTVESGTDDYHAIKEENVEVF